MVKNKKLLHSLILSGFTLLGLLILSPRQVDAATLDVTTDCTLSEAIIAVNGAADGSGCIKTGAVYGTNDTVVLQAGTTTLAADLPAISKPITIQGAGRSQTTIDANGNTAIKTDYISGQEYLYDLIVRNLKIIDADTLAIDANQSETVLVDGVEIVNSDQAVKIVATHVTVSQTYIHDNVDATLGQDSTAGLRLELTSRSVEVPTTFTVTDTRVNNNTGDSTGIRLITTETTWGVDDPGAADTIVTMQNVVIDGNHAESGAGIVLIQSSGPLAVPVMQIQIEATTISNNEVVVTQPQAVPTSSIPVMTGLLITGKLSGTQTVTNVTIANNTIDNPSPDTRQTVAGFVGTLSSTGAPMAIRNTTVVGNSVNQPSSTYTKLPAFFAIMADLDTQTYMPIGVTNGSNAVNVLIARNSFNGNNTSCFAGLDATLFGLTGLIDLTPTNLGHNITDDQSCTGYNYIANIYDTMDHEVKDNGGPVPTIALLPGSPAINGGGQVQGVSTDARGVARTGYVSVGAYQGVLLAANTSNNNGGDALAETGAIAVSAGALLAIFVIGLLVVYADYRRHKKPLKAVDPKVQYGFIHHVNVVTLPLLRYRLFIRVLKKNPYSASGVHKF